VVVTKYFATSAVSGGQKLENMHYLIYYLSTVLYIASFYITVGYR
jgi:hypothetical protein